MPVPGSAVFPGPELALVSPSLEPRGSRLLRLVIVIGLTLLVVYPRLLRRVVLVVKFVLGDLGRSTLGV